MPSLLPINHHLALREESRGLPQVAAESQGLPRQTVNPIPYYRQRLREEYYSPKNFYLSAEGLPAVGVADQSNYRSSRLFSNSLSTAPCTLCSSTRFPTYSANSLFLFNFFLFTFTFLLSSMLLRLFVFAIPYTLSAIRYIHQYSLPGHKDRRGYPGRKALPHRCHPVLMPECSSLPFLFINCLPFYTYSIYRARENILFWDIFSCLLQ